MIQHQLALEAEFFAAVKMLYEAVIADKLDPDDIATKRYGLTQVLLKFETRVQTNWSTTKNRISVVFYVPFFDPKSNSNAKKALAILAFDSSTDTNELAQCFKSIAADLQRQVNDFCNKS